MTEDEKLKLKNSFDGSMVFGTKKFNKETGRNDHTKIANEQATQFFIDPEKGALKTHMALYRDCPVCSSKDASEIFIKNGFRHVKCDCGFIFVNPTARDEYRDEFFKDEYEAWTGVLLTDDQESIDYKKFLYGLTFIESQTPKKGKVVDVGAGSGLFLRAARERGWDVSGVEFNTKAVEHIRSLGIDVNDKPLEEGIYADDSIDLVTAWEVLEHINDPNTFVKQIKIILKPDGMLFICVPNINALVTRILHEKSRTFGGFSHVNFFNIETLSKMLERHGFEVVATDTVISELGTIKNYLAYDSPYSGTSDLSFAFLTPEYLYKNDLGSRIFLLAKNK